MRKPYWIIEHPTRGVYVGNECYGNGSDWNVPRPRFRWSIRRDEGMIFNTPEAAYKVWSSLGALQRKTYVMRLGNNPPEEVIVFK